MSSGLHNNDFLFDLLYLPGVARNLLRLVELVDDASRLMEVLPLWP